MKLIYSDIRIEGISVSAGDRLYLKISYKAKSGISAEKQPGEITDCIELYDEVLMRALFEAQLINGWSSEFVYYRDSHYKVGVDGEWIKESRDCIQAKEGFIRSLQDDQAYLIVENELKG